MAITTLLSKATVYMSVCVSEWYVAGALKQRQFVKKKKKPVGHQAAVIAKADV